MIAHDARPVRLLWTQVAVLGFQFVLWAPQALTGREPLHVVLAALTGVAFVGCAGLALSGPRVTLVLGRDTLEIRRRIRPLSVPRADVVAVRGDVAGRPTWSGQVLVETRERTVRLPALDRTPGELIPRLQEWAGVGEQPLG